MESSHAQSVGDLSDVNYMGGEHDHGGSYTGQTWHEAPESNEQRDTIGNIQNTDTVSSSNEPNDNAHVDQMYLQYEEQGEENTNRYTEQSNFQDQWFEFDEESRSLTQTIVQQHTETVYDEASESCCRTVIDRYYTRRFSENS